MSAPDPSKPAEGVHRLTDIDVQEVSLVDRAANKQVFLIAKRDPMAGTETEVVVRADGTAEVVPSATPAAAPATTKAGVALTADAKKALDDAIAMIAAQLDQAKTLLGSAQIVDAEDAISADPLVEPLMGACEQLETVIEAIAGAQPDDAEAPAEEGAEGTTEAQAAEPQAAGEPQPAMSKRLEVQKARLVVAKADDAVLVRKYGVRLKAERLSRFKTAMSMLASLLGEIDSTAVLSAKAKAPPPAAAAAPPTKPDDKKKPGAVATPPATPAAAAMKADVTAQIAKLEGIVKAQQAVIAKAASTVAPSRALGVDASGATASDRFKWPSDVSAPATPDDTF